MIYLIGGAMRIGKSIIGREIAKQSNSSFISTDDICRMVIANISKEEKSEKFPSPAFSANFSENTLSSAERVERQVKSAKSLTPYIEKVIRSAIEENKSIVIEGVHVLPEQVHQLLLDSGKSQIKYSFLGMMNTESIYQGIVNNTSSENWMKNTPGVVVRQVAEFTRSFSEFIQKECDKYDLKYTERTSNFEEDKRIVIEGLLGAERKIPQK